MTLRKQKQAIRAFLRTDVWSDEKLCALLAHAQDKLSMWSCCCLIGVATADHALRDRQLTKEHPLRSITDLGWAHFEEARFLPLAQEAERAFSRMGGAPHGMVTDLADEIRRRLIRPIIRTELRRRERERLGREQAILALAQGFAVQRVDLECIENLSEVACPTANFAELLGMGLFHSEEGK